MPESRKDQNLNDSVVDLIDKAVFFGYSTRINCPIVSLQRFNLTRAGSWMFAEFIQYLASLGNAWGAFL